MCLELITNAVSAIGTIVIAFVAITGYNRWQKEIKGRANFDLARSLLGTVYHLRDEIERCRHPFQAAHEFPEDFDPTQPDDDKAMRFIYSNRLKSVNVAWEKFNTRASEAEVLWQDEIKENVELLKKCVIELNVYTKTWLSEKHYFQKNPSKGEKYRRVFEVSTNGDDEFSQKVEAVITDIESKLRPHISFYDK